MGTLFYQNDKTAEKAIHAATFSNAKVFNSISPGHRFERQRDTVTPGSARPGTASQENLGIRFPGWGMLAKTRYALP